MTVAATTTQAPRRTPEPRRTPAPRPTGGVVRGFRDSWVITRRQLTRMRRVPEVLVLSLVQPVIMILLFAYIFGGAIAIPEAGGSENAYREFMMAGFFAQSIAFTTVATASSGIAQDMTKGMVDRFRSLPMSRGAVLTGRTFADMVQNLCLVVVLIGVATLIGWRVHNGLLQAAAAFGLLLLMGYAFSWVGMVAGLSVRTPEAATSGFIVWMFPITFLSTAFVPPQSLPAVLQHIAEWNPFSATVQAARELFGNPGVQSDAWPMQNAQLAAVLWSVAMIVVFRAIAVRKYRKTSL